MQMANAKLTDAWMRRPQKPGTYWDDGRKGLGVRVSPKGTKSWVYQKAGRDFRTLGRWPSMTVPRAILAHAAAEASRGQPKSAAPPPAPTLAEAWGAKAADLRVREKSPRTIEESEKALHRYCPDWLARPVDEIAGPELVELHGAVGRKNGKGAANTVLRTLRAIHNHARRRHPSLGEWPGKGAVEFYALKRRKTFVEDIASWNAALEIEVPNARKRDLWHFCLYTALRNEDARTLRWDELRTRDGVMWAHRPTPKGGKAKAFDLPLSSHARAIVERQPRVGDWVWWSDRDPGKPWDKLRKPRGSLLARPHDLRRTWASVADEVAPHKAIQILMNHADADITSEYKGVAPAKLASWAQKIGDHLAAEMAGAK